VGFSITRSSSTSTEEAGDGLTASGIGEPLRKSAVILSFRSLNLSDIISSDQRRMAFIGQVVLLRNPIKFP
jgi:hypothetical protein